MEPFSGHPYWLIFMLADVDQQWYVGKPQYISVSAK